MIHNGSNVEYEYEYLMNGARGVARGGMPSPPPPSLGGPPVCITVSSVSAVVRCCVVWVGVYRPACFGMSLQTAPLVIFNL